MPYYDDYLDQIKKELQAGHRQWKRGDKLLAAFDYTRRRQTAIDLINSRLAAKGMFTVPELTTAMPLDRGITFYLTGSQVEDQPTHQVTDIGGGPTEIVILAEAHQQAKSSVPITVTIPEDPPTADEEGTGERSLIVGNLAAAERTPLQVKLDDSLKKAMYEMALHDYSQLVVVSGPKTIRGIVSYKSIAQAYLDSTPKNVAGCLDKTVPIVDRNEPLLDVIERFAKFDVVIVQGTDKAPVGIVTPADIAAEFGVLVGPFLMVGQIEDQLRWLVRKSLDLTEALALVQAPVSQAQSGPSSVSELTMGDLHRILSNDTNWSKLGITWNCDDFCATLDEVREIRNAVMHFRDLPEGGMDRLQKFARIVQSAYLVAAKKK